MACKKPLLRAISLGEWETALDGHKYQKATVMSSDMLENFDRLSTAYFKYELIPCGKCAGCRLENSRQWANRGYLERQMHENAWFVTLTYSDDWLEIPDIMETSTGITYTDLDDEWAGMLVPEDLKQFNKNLRQIAAREWGQNEGIRFIACGEYGSLEKRPHYHLIIFGIDLPTESFYHPRIDWRKCTYWQNEIIERAWGGSNKAWDGMDRINPKCRGICNITEANWDDIAYVARYVMKKINGVESEDYYAMQGQIKEFFRSSRKPGIGAPYYEKFKNEIYSIDKILIENKKGSKWMQPPKYFDDLLEKEDPKRLEEIKAKRRERAYQANKIKDRTTSLTRWEQLEVELYELEHKTKALTRPLESLPRQKGVEYGKARRNQTEQRRKSLQDNSAENQKNQCQTENQPGRHSIIKETKKPTAKATGKEKTK